MAKRGLDLLVFTIFPLLFFVSSATPGLPSYEVFFGCIASHSPFPTDVHKLLHREYSPHYSSILQSTIQNLRFNSSIVQRPRYIFTPLSADHVRAAVLCSKNHSLQVRIRSGGHDYEGLSYRADTPFVLIDLFRLRKVKVDLQTKTAWVGAGATLGELYYQIANHSNQALGFPAGICSSIGVGGHLSGGGQGALMRKFGLAADNVVDAILVNVNGDILDRKKMGEDLFWAIRGGGGASFGVIVEWKVNLVPVPPKVTAFNVPITLQQDATAVIHRWQKIAYKFPEDLFIRIILTVGKESDNKTTTVRAIFNALYLGPLNKLFPLVDNLFPELGKFLKQKHCQELNWIESVLFLDRGFAKGRNVDVLMDRTNGLRGYFKAKSDFVDKPITKDGLKAIWNVMEEGAAGVMIWDPYGGKMSEIPRNATPFPFRAGTLYNIQYYNNWNGGAAAEKTHKDWINKLYNFMGPYVSQNPRGAYLNYRDLSLGVNNKQGNPSYLKSKVWGEKYFKNNFERLAHVKRAVDPGNFFRNEQSIPPYSSY